jgi:hypothetical protein
MNDSIYEGIMKELAVKELRYLVPWVQILNSGSFHVETSMASKEVFVWNAG